MKKAGSLLSAFLMLLLLVPNLPFAIPAYAAESNQPSLGELEANDYIVYFVNAGNPVPEKVAPDDKMGLYQSTTEQVYGPDPKTGYKWGYTTTYKSSASSSASSSKFDTVRYYDAPVADKVANKGLEYKFDLPKNKYEVTLGYKNPWSTRESDILLEGNIVDHSYVVNQGKEQTKTYEIEVTDGELNIGIVRPSEGGSATSQWADPLVSFIIIKVKVDISKEMLQKSIDRAEAINRDDYTAQSLKKLDQALEEAKVVLKNDLASQEEIDRVFHQLNEAYKGLVKPYSSFVPGAVWNDTNGVPIQAHGGGIMKVGDTYYWYGEDKTKGYLPATGVRAYSSKDLYNWKDEGVVMKAIESRDQFSTDPYFKELYSHRTEEEKDVIFSDINAARGVLERPKVIYNDKTGKYVLWLHVDGPYQGSDANYAKAKSGVAISDSPTGPFEYLESNRLNKAPEGEPVYGPDTGMARDMTLFKDDDGTAYIIYSSEENMSLYISKLTDDYTKITGEEYGKDYIRALPGMQREAPAMFKYDGRYYLMTSGATGWDPNQARYAVADSVMGKWTDMGDPSVGSGANTTFQSQSTFIIPVDAEKGKFIYMGDRWFSGNLSDSRYIWLPLEFNQDGGMTLKWYDEWSLGDLENKGKITLLTKLPDAVALGDNPELPEELEVINNGIMQTVPVIWEANQQTFSKPGPVTISGTMPTLNNRGITKQIIVIPENVKYFVSPGNSVTQDYQAMTSYMESSLLNKEVNDQVYDSSNGKTWGYSGGVTATTNGSDIFSTLRYITKESNRKDFTYTFEIEDGNYTVYAGFYDPWAQYANGIRKADVFVNEDLVDFEYTYSNKYDVREYKNIETANGKIEVKVQTSASVAGRANTDTQISWIMIVDNAEKESTITIDPVNELANKVTGTVKPGSGDLTVSLPNGKKIIADVKKDGRWKAKLPNKSLNKGDLITVVQMNGIFKEIQTVKVEAKPGNN